MKKIIPLFCLVVFTISFYRLSAQDTPQDKKWEMAFHGFIKSDVWYDSRQVAGAREDLFLLYPKRPAFDRNGRDIHDYHSFNFTAITTRLNGTVKGPDAFGAKSMGVMEADFSGLSNADVSGFRLRHAYVQLSWKHSRLIMGHYWHPFFVTEVFPSVLALNTGAPFQPFIRSPQVQFNHQKGNWTATIAALSQLDYMNDGPEGPSPKYLRQSGLPNFHFQMQYQQGMLTMGSAADWKRLRPKVTTDSLVYTEATVDGWSYMLYFKVLKEPWQFKAKAIYGQNLTEHLLLGGYAEKSYDATTGTATYTPTQHMFFWANLIYQASPALDLGIFAGYATNMGTLHNNTGRYFARGSDIEYAYRIAPMMVFKSGKVHLMTEIEYTVAAYGQPAADGRVLNSRETANLRTQITAFHFF